VATLKQTLAAGYGGLVDEAARWVREYFHKTTGAACFFHNYQHTWDTVVAGIEIAEGMQIFADGLETVIIACWFHDIEWFQSSENHEQRSAKTAGNFLMEHGIGKRKISAVKDCILATKVPPKPITLLEKIICDADVSHLGMENYYEKNLLLRQECEVNLGITYSDTEWLTLNRDFFRGHRFFTSYAQKMYSKQKSRNLKTILELLKKNEVTSPDCGQIGWM